MDLVDRVASRTPSHSSFTIFLLSPTVSGLLIDKNPVIQASMPLESRQLQNSRNSRPRLTLTQRNRVIVSLHSGLLIAVWLLCYATLTLGQQWRLQIRAQERCSCSSRLLGATSFACLQYSILQNYLGRYDLRMYCTSRGRGDHT